MTRATYLLIAIVIAGCAGAAPTPTPVATATAKPTPTATARATPSAPAAVASLDPKTCVLVLRYADLATSTLLKLGQAIAAADKGQTDGVVRDAVELARSMRTLTEAETQRTFVGFTKLLQAVEDSELAYLTGNPTPFIDAIGDVGIYRPDLARACS